MIPTSLPNRVRPPGSPPGRDRPGRPCRPAAAPAAAVLVALLAAIAAVPPAASETCSLDLAPAATVLLPYFEVDLGDPGGATTLFALNNALPEAEVVRVTLWTDLAVPTYAFDLYLTGYDVQSFNLRDLFSGLPPVTGGAVTPDGRFSLPGSLIGCPGTIEPEVPVAHLRAAHSGQPSPLFGNLCAGLRHADGRARGYLTADVVGECGSGLFPSDPGYFGPGGVARFDNALWGDYYLVDPRSNFAFGDGLVRLEADPQAFLPGDRTFYGRYLDDSAADAREPLPGVWALRHLAGGGFSAGTRYLGWREVPGPPLPGPCGARPAPWYPLGLHYLLSFDEEENGYNPYLLPISPPPPPFLPAAAQLDPGSFFAPFGWLLVDLGRSAIEPAQAFVATVISAEGRYGVASAGTPLSSGCDREVCALGIELPVRRLCVLGADFFDPVLEPGDSVLVRAASPGCHSASCVEELLGDCAVRPDGDGLLEVAARICLAPTSHACLPACDFEPSVVCASEPLEAGVYTLRHGGAELTFTVPSVVPPGGLCAEAGTSEAP